LQYTHLGKSGIKISRVGLGVWQASGEWRGDDRKIIKAIGRSLELGVNLLDTAEVYGDGHSEKTVRKALKAYGRENFVIATKVYGAHLRYEELQRACEGSLKRMGIREIDLYQVHWPDPWEQIPLKHTMKALEKLHREGKIRSIGVSNFAVRDISEARSHLSGVEIVSDQVRYNLLQREVEEEVLPYCNREGISIIAWSPIGQGALSGRYTPKNAPKKDVRRQNQLFEPKNIRAAKKLVATLSSVAEAHESTPAQVALAWLVHKDGVIPIPGAKSPEQAEANAHSVDLKLSREELDLIQRTSDETKIDYYTMAA
jgi:aryl-alcohol dehydrogenase-like predicted oxidoreductase